MNPLSVNLRIYCSWGNHRFRSGLDITLDEMPNNGVVLVVTSAGSHQLELEKSIKEKSSKKNVKIYFTFSPFCREACGDSLPVYKRLSDNRMFNLSDFSSKSFLETVVYTVWKKSSRFTHLHMWRSPITDAQNAKRVGLYTFCILCITSQSTRHPPQVHKHTNLSLMICLVW